MVDGFNKLYEIKNCHNACGRECTCMNPSVEVEIKRVAQDPETLTVISLPTFPPFFRPSTSASIVVHFTLPPAVYRKIRPCSFVYVFIYIYKYSGGVRRNAVANDVLSAREKHLRDSSFEWLNFGSLIANPCTYFHRGFSKCYPLLVLNEF